MLVKAKDTGRKYSGFYGNKRRIPGEVFDIESEEHLGKWMEPIQVVKKATRKKAVKAE